MIFVHKLFDIAVTNGIRMNNPCDGLRRLPQQHKEMAYYTPEQFKRFDSLLRSQNINTSFYIGY